MKKYYNSIEEVCKEKGLKRYSRVVGPWYIPISKKKNFIPNLNQYRNTHYLILSKAKNVYAEMIKEQLENIEPFRKIKITLIAYPPTKRLFDLDNLAPHMKFFLDALVSKKIIEDDNYNYVVKTIHEFGCVDKINPRIEFIIGEVEDE